MTLGVPTASPLRARPFNMYSDTSKYMRVHIMARARSARQRSAGYARILRLPPPEMGFGGK